MPGKSHVFKINSLLINPLVTKFSALPLDLRVTSFNVLHRRRYSTPVDRDAPSIGILGGGITGLATAYYLSSQLPRAQITIYEKTDRLGGWINSRRVNVKGGEVLFESGSRSLRPEGSGLVTVHLIKELGLENEVLYTDRKSVSARNRFIYYPDHLVQLPGPGLTLLENLRALLFEPALKGAISGLLFETFRKPRGPELEDESIGDFISRRLGYNLAQNLVSAVMHGIYAGDIWQLSSKSLLTVPWFFEKHYESVIKGFLSASPNQRIMKARDVKLRQELLPEKLGREYGNRMASSSVFTFKNGLQQLTDKLKEVVASKGVKIKTDTTVTQLQYQEQQRMIEVVTKASAIHTEFRIRDHDPAALNEQHAQALKSAKKEQNDAIKAVGQATTRTQHNYCISSLLSSTLASVTPDTNAQSLTKSLLPSLSTTHAVTVLVVNLFFADPSILPVRGFGYLIPQSVPFEQNPERALGVVFDSDAIENQDSVRGTKVTVMLGGHYWDGWETYPKGHEAINMALAVLSRHLGIKVEPKAVSVTLQENCIPQYTVGHDKRMRAAHEELERSFHGTLKVAGNSYSGVGVNDCIRSALDVTRNFGSNAAAVTGLDTFTVEDKWELVQLTRRELQDQ